jgi:hypothetical protein
MFCNFYLLKNNKITNNLTITKAREKICTIAQIWNPQKIYNIFIKFKTNKILVIKISH